MTITSCKISLAARALFPLAGATNLLFQTCPRPRVFEGNCTRGNTGALIATKLGAYVKFLMKVFRPGFSARSLSRSALLGALSFRVRKLLPEFLPK